MPRKSIFVRKTVTTSYSERDLIKILMSKQEIPENAKDISIYICVPGGGDYSNMLLNIDDEDLTLNVEYKIEEPERSN